MGSFSIRVLVWNNFHTSSFNIRGSFVDFLHQVFLLKDFFKDLYIFLRTFLQSLKCLSHGLCWFYFRRLISTFIFLETAGF